MFIFRKRYSRPYSVYSDVASIEQLILEVQDNRYLSPGYAEDRYFKNFPPTSIVVSRLSNFYELFCSFRTGNYSSAIYFCLVQTVEMDPCIDDCVMFAKKLDQLKVPVELEVLKNLSHGFLNFSFVSILFSLPSMVKKKSPYLLLIFCRLVKKRTMAPCYVLRGLKKCWMAHLHSNLSSLVRNYVIYSLWGLEMLIIPLYIHF